MGYRVNVNAVTAQTNNVVQDYALVISCGDGQVTNAMTVHADTQRHAACDCFQSHRRPADHLSFRQPTTTVYQLLAEPVCRSEHAAAGHEHGSVPGHRAPNGFRAEQLAGDRGHDQPMAFLCGDQHVRRTNCFTNAAFITLTEWPDPDTLSIPRMGVFADTTANATRPKRTLTCMSAPIRR